MKDKIKAIRRAAQGGDRDAQFQLGCAYLRGELVRRNRVVALKWLILAAWIGDEDADFQVKLMRDELGETQMKRGLEKALRWKFDRDKNSMIEQIINSTQVFSEEQTGEDQEEQELPTYVKMS